MATSKNYGKKKGSDHFRDILNPYGEKPYYGKIGRRRRLSKLNVFFFHNSVGDHRFHQPPGCWLENPRSQWRFMAGKTIELNGRIAIARSDY